MAKLWLIRHGQTDWNLERRYQGQTDIPLNATGIAQAERLADRLHATLSENGTFPQAVYSSDLQRASRTAAIIAERLGLPLRFDRRLREICQGEWEGKSLDQVAQEYAEQAAESWNNPVESRAPGGESVAEVAARMAQAADEICRSLQGSQPIQAIVVSHGLSLATLRCAALNLPLTQVYDFIPDNADPVVIEWRVNSA